MVVGPDSDGIETLLGPFDDMRNVVVRVKGGASGPVWPGEADARLEPQTIQSRFESWRRHQGRDSQARALEVLDEGLDAMLSARRRH